MLKFFYIFLSILTISAMASVDKCGLDHITLTNKHLTCMKNSIFTKSVVANIGNFVKEKKNALNAKNHLLVPKSFQPYLKILFYP